VKKIVTVFSLISLVTYFSCEKNTGSSEDDLLHFKGTVYIIGENYLPNPLANVLVTARGYYKQTLTDTQGEYELSIELSETQETTSLMLEFSKIGYNLTERTVEGKKGQLTYVPDIMMTKLTDDSLESLPPGGESGNAAHIEVYGSHSSHVYIKGSGLKESAMIQFLVTDAEGRRVDEVHKVKVYYSILNGPGGGEYLYPDTMTTRDGFAYTVLNSGIISGAIQIEAYFDVGGNLYRSLPIPLSIYGGLPDDNHFSVALELVNIAGQVHFGIIDRVTAYVGDKYSNPVAPGTAVYFSTEYGIIEGSAITDEMGRATVRYMSAFPLPPQPALSSFAEIKATTYGDTVNTEHLDTYTSLLLSGPTAPIVVTPTSFTYTDLNQPVAFNYTVSDIWGYPLIGGSQIDIDASDGNVYGDIDVKLLDTQGRGPGYTQFNFAWAPGDSLEAPQVYINIKVTTPENGNGYQSVGILGTKQ
jgi:hypothetical protein